MLVVRKASGLRRQRGRYRALAGAAGEHHFLALGIGNLRGIEGRKRDDYAAGIGLDGDLVRLADIDQEIASLRHSLRYFLRHQILHLVIRHAKSSNDPVCGQPSGTLFRRPNSPLAPRKSSSTRGSKVSAKSP